MSVHMGGLRALTAECKPQPDSEKSQIIIMQKAPDDAAVPQKPRKGPLFKLNLKGFKEGGGCVLKGSH